MKTNYSLKNVFASAIVVCGILFSHAEAQIVDGINYKIINGNAVEVAPLPKNGETDVRYTQASIVIPANVTIAGTSYPVKKIGANSMRENPNLTSITIPAGVDTIGNSSFAQCPLLPSVVLPASVKAIEDWAFYGCSKLESINIPDGITAITEHTFQNTGLKSITLPPSVKSLKTCAFQSAADLASINLENITSIGAWSLYGTAIQSANVSNVATIMGEAFRNCEKLEAVKLNKVGTLGNWSFTDCKKLKKVDLGTLESINEGAFSGCTALDSLAIPSNVVYVGNWALEKTGLKQVFISWEDTTGIFIEQFAFGKDEGKANFTWKVPEALKAYYGDTWIGYPVAVGTFTGIKAIQNENAKAYYSNGVLNLVNIPGYTVSVFSIDGKMIEQFRTKGSNDQVPVTLSAGIYILNATNLSNKVVCKFIVK